jgi:hypothetical protein
VLLVAGELHLGDTALEVLNIGTGPAPALYAINDFYQELRAFSAQANECQRLYTPPPRLRSIEDSRRMVSRVHNLSESRVAPGRSHQMKETSRGSIPKRHALACAFD